MKMTTMDDIDIERALQEELDALSLDDPIDETLSTEADEQESNELDTYRVDEHAAEKMLKDTRDNLERAMQERLAAFEKEIDMNFKRYEIDYDEIDELLRKPVGDVEQEIEMNVAQSCGIEREELNEILRSINAEEPPLTSRSDVDEDADRGERLEEKEEMVIERNRSASPSIVTDQPVPITPREKEDPNAVLHNERLAESHRRMLDELALLEQRRKEEEERYAVVLKEQQARLAEEYRRLQESLNESVRQTQQEKLQFESIRREQEHVLHERQVKMAILIQAWYRGRRIYRQYHSEILKRTAPVLKVIEKRRKKKEQEERANAMKLAKIEEIAANEKENQIQQRIKPALMKEEPAKIKKEKQEKKKPKPSSIPNVVPPLPPPIAQISQMEDPADFVPTVYPEPRTITSPRPPPEPRPKSAQKAPKSARIQSPLPAPMLAEPRPPSAHKAQKSARIESPVPSPLPVVFAEPRPESAPKAPNSARIESPVPPPLSVVPAEPRRPPSAQKALKAERMPSPPASREPESMETNLLPSVNTFTTSLTIDDPQPASALLQESMKVETTPTEPAPLPTPRVRTPRKPVAIKNDHSFLGEARRWAERTKNIAFATLLQASEENAEQSPNRRTAGALRKLPDFDPNLLSKLTTGQIPHEVSYLLLEHLLTPCSLALVGAHYPNLTHLTLRQCKLVHLIGLDACPLLRILDIENNWLEQVALQSTRLEYLNMSRNRVTSLHSIHTPQLKYLNVSNNRLTRLSGLETFINLNVLVATSNQLLTTIGLQGCARLLHLDLSDNHLVEMDQLDQCPLLITVKATSNALIQMPHLSNAILLHELDLSSNSLNTVDDLFMGGWFPYLTHLKLTNNALQELSSIRLPALKDFDLAYNQLSDASMLKKFLEQCPSLIRLNLEQNPVLHDMNSINPSTTILPRLLLLPRSIDDLSTAAIEFYLDFLSQITSMVIALRQTLEQYQIEPNHLLKSIHQHCENYVQAKKITAPVPAPPPAEPKPEPKPIESTKERSIIRLQAHWRRRLVERALMKKHRAAQIIQARWRGHIVRRRMQAVRHLLSHQSQPTYDEIDLTQFDFDEAAFDARFERPRTPAARPVRQVWQPPPEVLASQRITTTVVELPLQNTSRTSSAASSRAKPLVEQLSMPSKTEQIASEWGLTPTSTTAALMLKRAEKMKWNAERRHKREQMDAFQRLQMARQHELPPGSLRMAKRPPNTHATKTLIQTQKLSPPSTAQSRPARVFEWIHTQVARFDESPIPSHSHISPRNERKRLPSLDGSIDSSHRGRSSDPFPPPQAQRWSASTVSVRQPPPLLPPITGHHPRV